MHVPPFPKERFDVHTYIFIHINTSQSRDVEIIVEIIYARWRARWDLRLDGKAGGVGAGGG